MTCGVVITKWKGRGRGKELNKGGEWNERRASEER